ncbi:hypothetical protein FAI41_02000 [Acetobacteraceae bacterium]|nr:hypothetical protein FAI41_02000 [Acetobacteraceae bacterium]
MSKQPKRVFLPSLDRFYLKEAVLHYLARFSTTKQKTAQMLSRKIMRWGFKAEKAGMPESAILEIQESAKAHIPEIIEEMVSAGAIDDLEFGRSKVRYSAGKKSRRLIAAQLAAKGLSSDLLEDAMIEELGEAGEEKSRILELQAAIRLAKKRKIGPFQMQKTEEADFDDMILMQKFSKEMGVFARAGFSAEMAGKVLKMDLERALAVLENQGLEQF